MQKLSLRFIFSALAIVFTSFGVSAQLQVQTITDGNQLAETLVGIGVLVENVDFDCPDGGAGTFNGEFTNLGIDEGIMLTSGTADIVASPNNQGGATGDATPDDFNPAPGDPDLDLLVGAGGTFDACVLEFDVTPFGDELRFNYVFGSEEYLEFVFSFNDVFGFFISGPNPAGGDYINENIALVPNSDPPQFVSIDNINDQVNPEFYVDNGDGFNPGPNSTIQYDGFTTVLEAIANVIPCETYHLKLAVADAFDGVLDSGVFLEAESLSVPAVTIAASTTFTTLEGFDNTLEGCIDGVVTFTRIGDESLDLTVPYVLAGTATNGEDYEELPGEITIPAGENEVQLLISTIDDGIEEGDEVVELTVTLDIPCADSTIVQTVEIIIEDQLPIEATATPSTIAPGESSQLLATGGAGFGYDWLPSNTLSEDFIDNPIASPSFTTTYQVANELGECEFSTEVTVTVTGGCTTDAGTVTASPETVCLGDEIMAVVSDEVLDDDDNLVYVLHNNPNGNITAEDFEIYAVNDDGIFDGSSALSNTTVYISTIAGNDDGEGGVDLSDECLSVSLGFPVMFRELSAGIVSLDPSVLCAGGGTTATVSGEIVPEGAILIYAAHNSPDGDITMEGFEIYATSTDGVFDGTGIPTNETVYVSSLVASTDENGDIDLTDACLSVSEGAALFIGEISAGVVTTTPVVCGGGTTESSVEDALVPDGVNLVYILHNSAEGDITMDGFEIYATSTDGSFENNGVPTNETLYVSSVAGSDDGDGGVDLNDPCLSVSAGAPVVFLNNIEISVAFDCDEDSGQSTATFSITGGLPEFDNNTFYTIEGDFTSDNVEDESADGVFFGNDISVDYVDGDDYLIVVTDDNGCDGNIDGSVSCQKCTTEAGFMSPISQSACGNATVSVQSIGANLNEGDVLMYAIHTDMNTPPGDILAMNDSGTFMFSDLDGGEYNTTYYLSAIAGPTDENGNIDLGDACLDIVTGPEVVFLENLSLVTTPTCLESGLTYDVAVTINGGAADSEFNVIFNGEASVQGSIFLVEGIPSNTAFSIEVMDENGCSAGFDSDIISCLPPTAIELLNFDGRTATNGNLLYWNTATETDNDYFILQKSTNGTNFTDLTTIDSKGETSTGHSYEFLDKNVMAGVAYYRLASVDIFGEKEFANIVELRRGESSNIISIAPVPATDILNIELNVIEAQNINIQLFDISGKEVLNQNFDVTTGLQNLPINIQNIAAGVYMLNVTGLNDVSTHKVIKE